MIETKQEAMKSAYKECLENCRGPLKRRGEPFFRANIWA